MEKQKISHFVKGMRDEAKKAASIVNNLMQLTRREGEFNTVDINSVIDISISNARLDPDLLGVIDFQSIDILKDYADNLPKVACIEEQILELIRVIIKNAMQAIADNNEAPRLKIRTQQEGDMIRIELEDNGYGLDNAQDQKIFDPFYTTASPERTGLGLTIAYFIVNSLHQGTIKAETGAEHGTKIVIHLPIKHAKL